jgi:hypothetical protein
MPAEASKSGAKVTVFKVSLCGADIHDMKPTWLFLVVGASHAVIAFAPQARADVLIKLQNGTTIRARKYWIDGDLVKFENHGGVVGFARDSVVAIDEAAPLPEGAVPEKAADRPTASGDATRAGAVTRDSAGTSDTSAPGKASEAAHPAANVAANTDPDLAPVRGEDLETRMERLDKLSLTTHRELTLARAQGQADEVLDRLQHRLDEINRQRDETMKRLHAIH